MFPFPTGPRISAGPTVPTEPVAPTGPRFPTATTIPATRVNYATLDFSEFGAGRATVTAVTDHDLTNYPAIVKLVRPQSSSLTAQAPASVQLQIGQEWAPHAASFVGKDAQGACQYNWNDPKVLLQGGVQCSPIPGSSYFACSLYSTDNRWSNAACAQQNNSSAQIQLQKP